MGRGLLSDARHQLLQALDAGVAGEDERFAIFPIGVFLGAEHELESLRLLVQVVERDVVRTQRLMTVYSLGRKCPYTSSRSLAVVQPPLVSHALFPDDLQVVA